VLTSPAEGRFADGSHPTNTTIGATTMTTKARIEKTGQGGKYGVRITVESDGLRFAITSPGKPHAPSVLIPKDAKAIAQFITTAVVHHTRQGAESVWRL
jgi:hypothetical protein